MKTVRVGRFQFQKKTKEEWLNSKVTLYDGELAIEADTSKIKIGDGRSEYRNLPYITIGNIKFEDLTEEERASLKGEQGKPLGIASHELLEDNQTKIVFDDEKGTTLLIPPGKDGEPGGPQGPEGLGGFTPYFHIAYANSADGKVDFSVDDSTDKEYIGQYTSYARTGKGRNLIIGSNNILLNTSDRGNTNLTVDKGDYYSITPTNNGNVFTRNVIPSTELVKGHEYTLSFDISTETDIGVEWYANKKGQLNTGGTVKNTNGKWVRHEFTYSQENEDNNDRFIWGFHNLKAGSEVRYRNLKLEKGSEATEYSIAPEDAMQDSTNPEDYSWTKIKGDPGVVTIDNLSDEELKRFKDMALPTLDDDLKRATEFDALQGTDDKRIMTPLTTKKAIEGMGYDEKISQKASLEDVETAYSDGMIALAHLSDPGKDLVDKEGKLYRGDVEVGVRVKNAGTTYTIPETVQKARIFFKAQCEEPTFDNWIFFWVGDGADESKRYVSELENRTRHYSTVVDLSESHEIVISTVQAWDKTVKIWDFDWKEVL